MRDEYDPNRRPFPRGVLLEPFGHSGLHPIFRRANEGVFRTDNPLGYQHDLGAQDVFLYNFGILVSEQFNPALLDEYLDEITQWMGRWVRLPSEVVQGEPFLGQIFKQPRAASKFWRTTGAFAPSARCRGGGWRIDGRREESSVNARALRAVDGGGDL